jgi:hypothetical protein
MIAKTYTTTAWRQWASEAKGMWSISPMVQIWTLIGWEKEELIFQNENTQF